MFNKSFLLLDNNSKEVSIYRKKCELLNFKKNKTLHLWKSMDESAIIKRLRKDKIYLIFQEEEFYIKLLKLPKVRRSQLDRIIVSELALIFNDIKDFNYSYDVYSKSKTEIAVLIFCINSEKNNIFDLLHGNCDIRGIYLLQFIIFDYFIKHKVCNDGLLIFMCKGSMYILACFRSKVISNSVIKGFNGDMEQLIKKIDYVVVRATEFERHANMPSKDYRINLFNIDDKNIINVLSNKYRCFNLGDLDVERIITELR